VKAKIQQFANEWSEFANISFSFIDSGDADIRIDCNDKGFSNSYIGTSSKRLSQEQPTMNFGWFTDSTDDTEFSRTVVHEFGHAIGLAHEQASPVSNIPWNKPFVYDYYMKTYGWDQGMVDGNVFSTISQDETSESPFDRTSIMQVTHLQSMTIHANLRAGSILTRQNSRWTEAQRR
jgi:hypothetical protein